jgi:hypothetical protein
MTKNTHRGHNMIFVNDIWIYEDTKAPVSEDKDRPCGNCCRPNLQTGHDACLGTLPGLMNACCGHGDIKKTFIQFLDGVIVRGSYAKIIIGILKVTNQGSESI